MKKIRLTETELTNIIKRIVNKGLFKNKKELPNLDIPKPPRQKSSGMDYRGVTIIKKEDLDTHNVSYYTLGRFYRTIEDAQSKIDNYLDYEEPSDSVWD